MPNTMKPIEPKLYTGIDYEFRPESFWTAASDPLAAILRNVKGRNRREMIRDYYAAGKLDQLSDELLGDALNDEVRISLGKIHPTFMGGEYLPNYARQEVEIARIALASTTSYVISLRARPSGRRSSIACLMSTKPTSFFLHRAPFFSLRERYSPRFEVRKSNKPHQGKIWRSDNRARS
jgi:hypothetical protein